MSVHPRRAIAIVGVGAVLPDAPDVPSFWNNLVTGRYSISETPRERWDPAFYYHPDPKAPLKTYSKIGGWVRDYPWDPIAWKLPIPPRVAAAMDRTQQWGVVAAREALLDYGYPERPLDRERTAVVMGNAMGGDRHYVTALHILLPEIAAELAAAPSFRALPAPAQEAIARELTQGVAGRLPEITEDTMPGELSNIIAGRIANLFDLHGPNFVCDAACASAMAAVGAAIEGLDEGTYDAVITGGIDANMSASTFVKFCKIGALSATGTRPYAEGADGFVMGEGAAVFLLKRLADAERDGDRVYAVLRGMGGASDGRGKGITAPNPKGQRLAVERAWQAAGLSPATVGYVEGHGTSTAVGDVVEVESLAAVFGAAAGTPGSIPLGSVKSNIGHLKGAAGAAGLLKAALALHHQMLPPSLHCERPNPAIDFARGPFRVNTALRPFESRSDTPRRACVSAFGFGGTNFHAVLEEWIPGRLTSEEKTRVAVGAPARTSSLTATAVAPAGAAAKAPLRGALLLGAADERALVERLRAARDAAAAGELPAPEPPSAADLAAPLRLAIDHGSAAELVKRCDKAIQAIEGGRTGAWRVLRAQGVVRWEGPPSKVAFLYTGQGSQYVNMLADLRRSEPIVAATFAEADEVMTPLFGRPLTDIVFAPESDAARFAASEEALKQTQYTQPAVLTVDVALTRLLAAYGITPDFVMGHSLGEYGALVAAGSLSFPEALEAVSARGQEMARLSVGDPGRMAAVFAPLEEIESVLAGIEGYVVVANINSIAQAVIGGETAAVERAVAAFGERGREARYLPVSHAFHTRIVAPASEPLRRMLARLKLSPPRVPLVSNASGRFYPMAPDAVPEMIELLGRQIAEPVQFVQGLSTIYEAGARVFVELGPKRALQGFVEDVLGDRPDVLSLATNHPKLGDAGSFNLALCGLYAAGRGAARPEAVAPIAIAVAPPDVSSPASSPVPAADARPHATASAALDLSGGDSRMSTLPPVPSDRFADLGRLFVDFLSKGLALASGESSPATAAPISAPAPGASAAQDDTVVVTGAALGLPGAERVFDDGNLARLLAGEQMLGAVPAALRRSMVEKRITRLVKSEEGGRFETIESPDEVIKLAARAGELEFGRDFGFPADRTAAFDRTTMLAIGAGIDALRDAGIPLVMRYKTTTTGTLLPDRWGLPEELRDGTGVIFGSAFPGYDQLMGKMDAFHRERSRRERLEELRALRGDLAAGDASAVELDRRIAALEAELVAEPFTFDRRFLFQVLSMGHSQFAEAIGARGPNTAINSACATTTQAFSLASDWIRAGRCDRVIVIAADDITSDNLFGWFASGFLASGAAATDERVEDAALPFDRRRHGLLIGMGAAAAVLERAGAARERGLAPICEVLSTVTANSAFHGSRLDVSHIGQMMEKLVADAESRWGIDRHAVATEMVFVSHETYTPARGGSAQAEIDALRRVFGSSANRIVIANTKGYTGHPMAVGIEDVMAIKSLETGIVPPVPNIREIDPDLGALNISRGGSYPVRYALRLGAGFGSQISMTLLRWSPTSDGRHRTPAELGFAYRIADRATWEGFLSRASGDPQPAIEVVHRTLRVVDRGLARLAPAPAAAGSSLAKQIHHVPAGERQAATAAAVPPGSQASVATPVAVTAPAASASSDAVTEQVLELIADKTGYPKEMLALDLDLEADLGIDTVKQAEVFAAIRERYGIERDPNLKLRDFPTIAKTIGFVYDKRPELRPTAPATAPTQILRSAQDEKVDASAKAGAVAPAAAVAFGSPTQTSLVSSSSTTAPTAVEDEVTATVLALVAEKTGYPREMLALDLDLEADLGVDTVKQAELFAAVREKYGIARDPNLKLRDFPTLAKTIGFVYDHRPELRPAAGATAPTQILPSAQEEKVDASANAGAVAFGSPTQTSFVSSSSTTAPTAVEDEVTATVLALVAEKTGYPREMLDLDLDLEADLGVDTVKQAELFAAVREKYGIARDPNLKLRDFPTLAKTIGFVYDHRPDLRPGASPATPPEPTVAAPPAGAPASEAAPALDAGTFCRRIPVAVLRPALSLCKATGVELGHGRRVFVAGDRGGVAAPLIAQLTALGVAVSEIDADAALDELAARVTAIAAEGVDGLYWLPALDVEPAIAELDLDGFHRATHRRVKAFAAVLRALYEPLGRAGAFVVSATRLGGRHGVGGASAPLGGAVSGMTKTWARERPAGLVKVVDFESAADASAIAEALLDETLRDPGAIEIGHAGGERFTVTVEVSPLLAEADGNRDADDGVSLGPDSVAVVTGAAGSIVAAIVRDLARHGGSFHLLDLAPEPDPADADLARFASDRDGLKLELFARLSAAGERATPARIEKELARLERQRAALDAIDAIRAAGGRATYHCLDLRDPAAVATAVETALAERGRIDLLLHAGGLEVSRLLPDKSDEELARVFDVKADGAFNLIRALRGAPLGALVTFGSIAGRFGNGGQADYAAANDFLAKLVASLATTQPGTLGLAFDWTGWAEIGMASRGSIPKLLEAAGIDLLPPSLGIPAVRRELAAGGPSREIVVAGRLGAMLDERETEGGLDPQAVDAGAPQGPMRGHARRLTLREGLVVELTLDPREQPFLDDHRIDGTPVLPGVMGIEAFAETARQLFPERRVAAVERLEFLAPFKFYRDEPRTLEVRGQFRQERDEIVAECLLVGRRALPGQATSQETEHFRGRVRLAAPGANPPVRRLDLPDLADASELASEAIYRVYFHGPAYQVVARARRVGEAVVAELSPALPPNHRPAELATEMEPRWIELAFQTAGLDQLGRLGTLGLPRALGRVALLAHPEPGESIFALSQREPDGTSSIALVAGSGRILLEVEGYATIDLPGAGDPETLAPIRQALGAEPALEERS